ncbi:MAG: B12-binding domain-containing radical SAM protein [Deltaproteobacteria bacterium]|nr:B12-binding domain-containing radical SAM protein [Deltaproteobacteria bacterium]
MTDFVLIMPALQKVVGITNRELLIKPTPHSNIPLSAIAIGSSLVKNGLDVKILDFHLHCAEDENELLAEYCRGVTHVGFSCMTNHIPHGLRLTKKVKGIYPTIKTVWGGIHPSLFPEMTIRHDAIDFVVVGEGEDPLLALMRGETHPRLFVKDSVFNTSGKNFKYGSATSLTEPNYELINLEQYFFKNRGERNLPLLSSRGCPSRCTFCVNTVLKNKWRGFSAETTCNLLDSLCQRYRPEHIYFLDENFFVDKNRAISIVKYLCNIDATWGANIRLRTFNSLSDETLMMLKKSGMKEIRAGAESGSNRILQILRKGLTVEEIRRAVEKAANFDLKLILSFMRDLPDETKEETQLTLNLVQWCGQNGVTVIGPQIFRPYPGSEEYDKLVQRGLKTPVSLEEWGMIIQNANHDSIWYFQ